MSRSWSALPTVLRVAAETNLERAVASELLREAAAEIEQLRAEIERLEKPKDRTMWGAGL